ncbi:MAG: carboxylating nicotinate-nucleotide diphosphorylase [Planctomycetota bacterium]|nr:carboxylating nicotinate-nucleotide diphosphorylase [Planctomycetota bacterium]
MAIQPNQIELDNLRRLLEQAKSEDLGGGDITSVILPEDKTCRGQFVAREELVFCGGVFLEEIAAAYDQAIRTNVSVAEGARVEDGATLAEWTGPTGAILSAERVALNFLQRLSGVATLTARYVEAVAGTSAGIYDTRKTTPGWRALEKYAVRAGGGCNHRMGLFDAVMVKDNHLAALGGNGLNALSGKLEGLRGSLGPGGFIEVEVDTLEQLADALKLDVDIILLDNMSAGQLAEAVRMRNESASGRIELEASGGITEENIRAVAGTGIERISIGALTHSARAVDIALEIDNISSR